MEIKVRNKEFEIEFLCVEAVQMFNKLMEMEAVGIESAQEIFSKKSVYSEKALDIVDVIMDSQDIDFDKKWWLRKTTSADIVGFLIECYKIEFADTVKKNQTKTES